jgi:hypothetical protein
MVQMHLAIRAILAEQAPSISTVMSAVMFGTMFVWMGRWEDSRKNYEFSLQLCRDLQSQGEYIDPDALTLIEETLSAMRRLPLMARGYSKKARMRYSCRILRTAKEWIGGVVARFGPGLVSASSLTVVRNYKTRIDWLLWRWDNFIDDQEPSMDVQTSPFVSAANHIQRVLDGTQTQIDLRLLTTQMTMGLKLSALYGACGDAARLRQAATGCHYRIHILKSMLCEIG